MNPFSEALEELRKKGWRKEGIGLFKLNCFRDAPDATVEYMGEGAIKVETT